MRNSTAATSIGYFKVGMFSFMDTSKLECSHWNFLGRRCDILQLIMLPETKLHLYYKKARVGDHAKNHMQRQPIKGVCEDITLLTCEFFTRKGIIEYVNHVFNDASLY